MEKRRVRADRGRLWTKVQSQPGPGQGLRGQGGMEGGSMAHVHVCIYILEYRRATEVTPTSL
jgi:hypothetical protein